MIIVLVIIIFIVIIMADSQAENMREGVREGRSKVYKVFTHQSCTRVRMVFLAGRMNKFLSHYYHSNYSIQT